MVWRSSLVHLPGFILVGNAITLVVSKLQTCNLHSPEIARPTYLDKPGGDSSEAKRRLHGQGPGKVAQVDASCQFGQFSRCCKLLAHFLGLPFWSNAVCACVPWGVVGVVWSAVHATVLIRSG